MAEKSFPLEATEYTAADAQLWFATRTSGVYAGEHLAATAAGSMSLTLGKGIAWMHYDEFVGCVYGNTSELSLTVEMSDAAYDRIDRVCIRLERLNNRCYAYVKKGTASSNPVPPALQRDNVAYEISVAQVYVGVGVTAINAGNITDERLDDTVCGLMRDGVTGIDTSVMGAQFNALIQELRGTLQAVYDTVEMVNIMEVSTTLLANGWSEDEPYTQTVAAAGVLGSDKAFVDVDMTNTNTTDEMLTVMGGWGLILKADSGADAVTFTAAGIPEIDVPVKIKVVR
jgi:hypothetical protein